METNQKVNLSRRGFIRGLSTRNEQQVFRLPWIQGEQTFLSQCTQCKNCISVCETQIIKRDSLGFPFVDFSAGECTFCRACVESCEQDMFTIGQDFPAWQSSISVTDNCLTHQAVFCQSCRDTCDYGAISFPLKLRQVSQPEIESELCVTCGSCVSSCPQNAINLSPGRDRND